MGTRLGWGVNITGRKKSACVIPEIERCSTSLRNREKSQRFWNYCSLNVSRSQYFVEFYFIYSIFRKYFLKISSYTESVFSNAVLTPLSLDIGSQRTLPGLNTQEKQVLRWRVCYSRQSWNTKESPPIGQDGAGGDSYIEWAKSQKDKWVGPRVPKARKMNVQDPRALKASKIIRQRKKPSPPYPFKN